MVLNIPWSNWQFNCAKRILASFRNGNLIGYQIHVKDSNGSAFHSNVTLNATTTSYLLTNLSVHHEYTVRAVAFTKMGLGPFSPPVGFKMDPSLIRFSKSTLSGKKDNAYLFNLRLKMRIMFPVLPEYITIITVSYRWSWICIFRIYLCITAMVYDIARQYNHYFRHIGIRWNNYISQALLVSASSKASSLLNGKQCDYWYGRRI